METICYNCFSQLTGTSDPCPHCGYDSASDTGKYPLALKEGSILNGRYILGRVLGQGGFGITYIAQDIQTNQRVAIKEYFPETMATRTGTHSVTAFSGQRQENFAYGMQCFLSEAQTLAQFIGNENIVRIHSYFEENGTAYFAMDYVEGVNLQHYLKQQSGKICWEDAKKILFPVMDALSAVHGKGIIHRDIAPDNILIANDGTVKLLDFGAARYSLGERSRSLDVVLKHGFAPKEQYTRRGKQGPFTDVYALAATFYYVLTGKLPPEAVDRIDDDTLILPSALGSDIPEEAELALEKGLAFQAADRFQSIAEFQRALKGQDTKPTPTPEVGTSPILTPKQKSFPWKPILFGGILVTALASASLFLFGGNQDANPAPPQEEPPTVQESLTTLPTILAQEETQETQPQIIAIPDKRIAPQTIAANSYFTVAVTENGTAYAVGSNPHGQCRLSDWTDMIALSAGENYTVGLRADGKVVATGLNDQGQCNVSDWTDIIAVAAGKSHTAGLKANGTVVATGSNYRGACNVSDWTEIIAVAVGRSHTVGLKADGTVVAVGYNYRGECNVSEWTEIVAIFAGEFYTVGLKENGTVVVAGSNYYGTNQVSDWDNIVSVSVGALHTIALKADGTVVATGNNTYGQCDVSDWKEIVAISSGLYHTIGLKADGTMVATGRNSKGQCDVSDWTNIRIP